MRAVARFVIPFIMKGVLNSVHDQYILRAGCRVARQVPWSQLARATMGPSLEVILQDTHICKIRIKELLNVRLHE